MLLSVQAASLRWWSPKTVNQAEDSSAGLVGSQALAARVRMTKMVDRSIEDPVC